MQHLEADLQSLVSKGKKQGYLTYRDVYDYLPDESQTPDELNNLVVALESYGIELTDEPPARAEPDSGPQRGRIAQSRGEIAAEPLDLGDKMRRPGDDPIRMYLAQMSAIPLLSREQEIELAKRIEITRKRFRRAILYNDYALRATVEVLRRVYQGELPF